MTADALILPGSVLLVIFLGNIEGRTIRNTRSSEEAGRDWIRARAAMMATTVVLIGISIEPVHTRLGTDVATMVHSLRSARLSRLDTANLERGYYENLLSVDRFNSQLWEVYTNKPANWLDSNAGLKRFTSDFAQSEMVPSVRLDTNYGTISINRWGMRDQDYARKPASDTYRIAMLGASTVMGWGVGDGQTFEALVEQRLNKEPGPYARYEILNFGVQGYQPLQQLVTIGKALEFEPNAVFYVATGREISRATWYLAEAVQKNIDIPFEALRGIVRKAGVTREMDETAILKRLNPYRDDILSWTYRHMAQRSRESGALPVLVFLPQVREGTWQEETPQTLRLAEDAGFTIINLADVYSGQDIAAVRLAEWDEHPNVQGHALIASRLYDELRNKRDILFNNSVPASKR